MTSQRKSRSFASSPTLPGLALKQPKAARRRRSKGNGQAQLSKSELEQMLLRAVHPRPGKPRTGPG